MESSDFHEDLSLTQSDVGSLSHQYILINILQAALKPHPFQVKIRNILDYIIEQKHLNLGERAVFFLVDHATETMTLKITNRLTTIEDMPCGDHPIGICHCGQVAASGKPQYFSAPPPLHDFARNPHPFPGAYCVPITKDGYTLAVLSIYVANQQPPTVEVESLLEAVANIFAVIIETQQMDQQLIKLVNDLRNSVISLREEKKFSESIIQGLKYGLIVADLKGKIIKSNTAAEKILRSFSRSLDNQYLADIFDDESALKLLEVLPAGSEQLDREVAVRNNDGENKIIGYSNVSREDARDNKVGVIISMADISELKYVRKEMEKMNRLSTVAEIASAVAHEVRNPLAGIKIMAQSIEEEAGVNSEQLECSQRIIRQVDRLNILLSDFFSYARPAEPNKTPTALATILAETKPLIQNKLSKSNIVLTEDIGDRLPPIIADPHQIQQVFLNLFLNAVDAIRQQGHINVSAKLIGLEELKAYKKAYPGLLSDVPYVVVGFTDNGSGMPQNVVDQVFEPFFTTKTSGAGLGLSIVYRTLKENDAEIVLNSVVGKGSTFTIFFQAAI
ncbi:ATP-binding protein [Desulforhopalus sp. 52FAK]